MKLKFRIDYYLRVIKNWFYVTFLRTEIKPQFYTNPLVRWPVNDNCFCGSKTKFKLCCKGVIAQKVDASDLDFIVNRLKVKKISL